MGNRSVLVYALRADPAAPRNGAVSVSIASQDGWHLAGVIGGHEPPDAVATRVVEHGLDAVLRPVVPSVGGGVVLSWLYGGENAPPSAEDDSGARSSSATQAEERG